MKFDFGALDTAIEADWPVRVPVPQDGGTVQEQEICVRYRLVDEAKLGQLRQDLEGSKAALRLVVVGFGKAEKTPFSAELFEKMMTKPFVRQALTNGYTDFVLGIPAKNSSPPPAS